MKNTSYSIDLKENSKSFDPISIAGMTQIMYPSSENQPKISNFERKLTGLAQNQNEGFIASASVASESEKEDEMNLIQDLDRQVEEILNKSEHQINDRVQKVSSKSNSPKPNLPKHDSPKINLQKHQDAKLNVSSHSAKSPEAKVLPSDLRMKCDESEIRAQDADISQKCDTKYKIIKTQDEHDDNLLGTIDPSGQIRDNLVIEIKDLSKHLRETGISDINPRDDQLYNMSVDELLVMKRRLVLLYEKYKNCIFVETLCCTAAGMTERYFDGKHPIFGFKPNLKGWSNAVQYQLRKNRLVLSEEFHGVVTRYGISPMSQFMAELAISAYTQHVNNTSAEEKAEDPEVRETSIRSSITSLQD